MKTDEDNIEENSDEGVEFPGQVFEDPESIYDREVEAARKTFGIKYLFPWQRLVISNILDSQKYLSQESSSTEAELDDCGDEVCRGRQIVLLPTGSGKSLCFLTPALLLEGATLIIYPLLALMADQKRRIDEAGIVSVMFKGCQSEEDWNENFEKLKNGAKIIIANPEILQSESLIGRLKTVKISHIAIDEAHCVSEWGDSFRPSYLTLGEIIKKLDVKIVTAFTATASPPVLARIKEVLFEDGAHLVQSSADRENIHYAVKYVSSKGKALLKECVLYRKPLIVFCSSRKRTEDAARLLSSYFGREKVRFYHAGMTKEEKNEIEKWFFDSDDGILTATCAYGMGMDKSNIRTVIHLDAPSRIENFIQEAGRAGRNGENVNSVLLWNHWDSVRHRQTPPDAREKAMGEFALSETCRRNFLLNYLSGEDKTCSGCDICDAEKLGKKVSQAVEEEILAYSILKKNRHLFSIDEFSKILMDKLNERDFEVFGMNVWEPSDIKEITRLLISKNLIKNSGVFWSRTMDISKQKRKKGIFSRHFTEQRKKIIRLRFKIRHTVKISIRQAKILFRRVQLPGRA